MRIAPLIIFNLSRPSSILPLPKLLLKTYPFSHLSGHSVTTLAELLIGLYARIRCVGCVH